MKITKDQLIKLYVTENKTTAEIANIFNIHRTTVSNKLKEFNIKINKEQRKFSSLKNISLTDFQKQMIIGSCLGDGSIILNGRRKLPYFKVAHCEQQKNYLYWKKDILGLFVNSVSKCVDKRENSIMYQFNTLSHKDLLLYRDLFYKDDIKIISKDLSNYITPLSMAVWYMDDGSLYKYNCRIATQGFSKSDNEILSDIIFNNFKICSKVLKSVRNNKEQYYLSFNKENSILLCSLVKPYFIDCMKYKLILATKSYVG